MLENFDDGKLYTLSEASKIFGYSKPRALRRRMVKMGIDVSKKGGTIFVKMSDVCGSCIMCGNSIPKGRSKYCSDKCMKSTSK